MTSPSAATTTSPRSPSRSATGPTSHGHFGLLSFSDGTDYPGNPLMFVANATDHHPVPAEQRHAADPDLQPGGGDGDGRSDAARGLPTRGDDDINEQHVHYDPDDYDFDHGSATHTPADDDYPAGDDDYVIVIDNDYFDAP